uniref:Death domain-containing protein n=1 Tax=Amphimedon queenslandica TaxID=400682 RepID=A0A1X7TBD8_AMPQE
MSAVVWSRPFCSLGVDDLADVLDLLQRCGFPETKWHQLGLRLGLKKNTLDAIEKNHPHDVSRCMTECLSQWLGRVDNVESRGGANLDSLSDALRSMNETAVAEKLKHHALINIFNNHHTVLSRSLCDSVGIAGLLYAERMLTQEAVSRVVSASPSIPNQREALLTAVKEAVQTDPNSLHTFANVLCTISTNVSLGQTILDDISKYFLTPEVDVAPETIKDHDVATQDNASTDETKIPTNTQSAFDMSPSNAEVSSNSSSQPLSSQAEVHIPIPKNLLANFSSIRMSYVRMFYNVCKILEQKLKVADIKKFLFYYSSSLSKKVNKCSDISIILRHVKNECSLTNIELLHSIVEEMKITEAEEHIKTYRTKLIEVCKSLSITLCLKERFNSVPHLQCQTVTFIFDWEPEEHVLNDIKDILSKVSGKLLIIKYIETSTSISVTCSFPFSDVGFTVLRMIENIHILMGQGLKKLTIGNLTLWRRQDVRQKELKGKDQDLLHHNEVISYIILKEAECRLRDAISSKEKETIELKQELSVMALPEVS